MPQGLSAGPQRPTKPGRWEAGQPPDRAERAEGHPARPLEGKGPSAAGSVARPRAEAADGLCAACNRVQRHDRRTGNRAGLTEPVRAASRSAGLALLCPARWFW